MSSALLGIAAALCWGIHDFLAGLASRAIGQMRTTAAVTLFGFAAISAWMVWQGGLPALDSGIMWIAPVAGAGIALATLWLFAAMANGPLSLAMPMVMTYPVTTLVIAAAMGRPPTLVQMGLALFILAGVVAVAISGGQGAAGRRTLRVCLIYGLLSHVSYAFATTLGQHAAAAAADAAGVTWLSRIGGLALIAPLLFVSRGPITVPRRWLPALALMGVLDVFALFLINRAGSLPQPELAIVGGASAVVVTVVMARVFLHESIEPLRWAGIAMAAAGLALLAVYK